MKTGKQSFSKKRNKIKFVSQNKTNNEIKEESKTQSIESTFASKNDISLEKNNKHQKLFLDYTFKDNKNMLYQQNNNEKLINITKARNYYYEIKKTFLLNIDLLLYYCKNEKIEDKKKEEMILLLNNIKKKENQKNEIILSIKKKCNYLISKYDNLEQYQKKYQNQINIYNIKISNKIKEIDYLNSYILSLKNRFSYVDIYIYNLRYISEGKKGLNHCRHKLKKCIEKNNNNVMRIKKEKENIKKIKSEISELKKDNKLSRRQNRLYKVKNPNINLIRVVEFYVRIIRDISLKNKYLKQSINSLCKTLEFLDLYQIKDFTEYKRNRQKSSYEIEFSDLENNYYEENINNIIKNRGINLMDFSKVLKL